MARLLRFGRAADRPRVGRVHPDGSISFGGRHYPTLKELPPECTCLRADLDTHRQWRAHYRVIDPRRRHEPPRT